MTDKPKLTAENVEEFREWLSEESKKWNRLPPQGQSGRHEANLFNSVLAKLDEFLPTSARGAEVMTWKDLAEQYLRSLPRLVAILAPTSVFRLIVKALSRFGQMVYEAVRDCESDKDWPSEAEVIKAVAWKSHERDARR